MAMIYGDAVAKPEQPIIHRRKFLPRVHGINVDFGL
jgi:hypothetical protein